MAVASAAAVAAAVCGSTRGARRSVCGHWGEDGCARLVCKRARAHRIRREEVVDVTRAEALDPWRVELHRPLTLSDMVGDRDTRLGPNREDLARTRRAS